MNPTIFTSIINSYLPDPQAALLNGIIFGIPLRSSKIFYQQLQVVGLLHLVVLSGMNITILRKKSRFYLHSVASLSLLYLWDLNHPLYGRPSWEVWDSLQHCTDGKKQHL